VTYKEEKSFSLRRLVKKKEKKRKSEVGVCEESGTAGNCVFV